MSSGSDSATWDCIVVGAGPAGLNAALVLGRARRRVMVLDTAQPRNYATHEMHGVLGHDGLDPADLRARGRAELARYGVEVVAAEAQEAEALDGAVRLSSTRGVDVTRTVLLATGMLDELPDIPGFAGVWGTSAHTCPYCDGFEHRDERIAVLASGARGEHLALLLRQWSSDVVLLSNGRHDLGDDQMARVHARGIPIIETPVAGLDGDEDGRLRRVRLETGQTLDRDALFFYVGWQLRNDVARTLGCQLRDDGSIAVDSEQATSVERVYAAGNCAEPRALVPAATGSGVTAAVAINVRLSVEDAGHAVANSGAPASFTGHRIATPVQASRERVGARLVALPPLDEHRQVAARLLGVLLPPAGRGATFRDSSAPSEAKHQRAGARATPRTPTPSLMERGSRWR